MREATLPIPRSYKVIDFFAHMVKQGKPGSKMKMVESIEKVYEFIHHPEFLKAFARGVKFEFILLAPRNDEEHALLEEIVNFTRDPEELRAHFLSTQLEGAYERGGVEEVTPYLMANLEVKGERMTYDQARAMAEDGEREVLDIQRTIGTMKAEYKLGGLKGLTDFLMKNMTIDEETPNIQQARDFAEVVEENLYGGTFLYKIKSFLRELRNAKKSM